MITVKNVSFNYSDSTPALVDINMSINNGSIIYLVGESGSGKTTVLKLLQGRIKPTQGDIQIDEIDLTALDGVERLKYRQSIGTIFQEFRLIPEKTVRDNIKVSINTLGLKWTEDYEQQMMLLLVKMGIGDKATVLIEALSYGEKQRVAIVRALIRKPKLLLADEPTGNLDDENALNVLKLLTELLEINTTIIIATHAVHLLDQLPIGRILQMRKGQLYEK